MASKIFCFVLNAIAVLGPPAILFIFIHSHVTRKYQHVIAIKTDGHVLTFISLGYWIFTMLVLTAIALIVYGAFRLFVG